MSLLDKARSIPRIHKRRGGIYTKHDEERFEVSLAYVRGEISIQGVALALGGTPGSVRNTICSVLCAAITAGRLAESK